MKKLAAIAIVIGLVATACSSSTSSSSTTVTTATTTTTSTSTPGGTTGTTVAGSGNGTVTGVVGRFEPSSISFIAALQRFDMCDEVLAHFKAEAIARVGPYGLNGGGGIGFPVPFLGERLAVDDSTEFAVGNGAAPATTSAAGQSLAPGVDFSETNVQVAGVDEPDIVKTDGERIVAVLNNTLYVFDVTGPGPRLLGSVLLQGGWDHSLFLNGDRALVFARANGDVDLIVTDIGVASEARSIAPDSYGGPLTMVHEVDLSDSTSPRVVRTLSIEGNYLSARAIDGTVRVVISSYPANLPFVYPSGPAAEAIAEAANRQVIEQSTLQTWLPSYTLTAGGEVLQTGLAVACDRVHRPAEFAGFDTLSVLTLDLGTPLNPGEGAAVIAQGQTVYASTQSLYVATNVWVPQDALNDPEIGRLQEMWSTALHKFDISGTGPAEYLASGSVDGQLLNQFSMDEFDGHLRVATTSGLPWGFDEEAESFVAVLRQDGDRLIEVGRVGDLGRGERIFSVRFVGDMGYVVTFRQVDPLYVVDLADPKNPSVAGELKIPGFSSYLHPIGPGRLLGVGQDATDGGRTRGAKVSLFDVSDPSNPIELDNWVLGDGSSDAAWDHRAFLYWAPEDAAILPVQAWQQNFFGAVVLKTDDGLREFGRVSHEKPVGQNGTTDCRRITEEDLGIDEVFGDEFLVQVCGSGQPGGAIGYYSCEVFPEDDLESLAQEFAEAFDRDIADFVGEGDRLEVCWPDFGDGSQPILRSIVIGDTLWTLSWRSLQSNDLGTLETLGQVAFA